MLSNGEAHRPLVHCRDIAAAFMELCETPTTKVKDLVVNFGPQNANLKVLQMAQETQKFLRIVNYPLEMTQVRIPGTTLLILKNGTHYSQGFNFAIHYLKGSNL